MKLEMFAVLLILQCLSLLFTFIECDDVWKYFHNVRFHPEQFLKHKTDMFYKNSEGLYDVIIRRAEYFEFKVLLNKAYSNQKVGVTLTFASGKDSMSVVFPDKDEKHKDWKFKQNPGVRSISVEIYFPASAPVGVWQLTVIVIEKSGAVQQTIQIPNRIVVLFNPFSKEDIQVYYENEKELDEYIMNERGLFGVYNWYEKKKRSWLFSQFKQGILDAVLFILGRADLNSVQRGDAVRIVRELSYLLNDDGEKDRGVLRGKWTPPYNEWNSKIATRPSDWIGSAPILFQYFESGGISVGFGQCWVFAGVFTTVLRAIGIPSRPVSEFAAAHDKGSDLTIDKYYDAFGYLNTTASDGVWNFHVWTQAWLHRADIGYPSDWQNTDATPQGLNGGRFQVGPAPTEAIKNAEIRKKFETAFLYMEINADEVHWKNGQFDSAYTNTIGLVVVTKGVGNYDLLDITDTFKFEEGSREERESYIKATKALKINATSLHYRPTARSVHRFTVKPTIEMPQVSKLGSTVPIVVVVKNPSNKKNVVSVGLKVTSTYYSATDGSVILKARKDNVEVPSGGVNKVIFQVKPEQYLEKLKDFFTNRVEAVVTNANGFVEYTDKHLAFATPVIKVDCPEEAKVGEPFLVYAEFVNPLNMVLADCYFNVEGQRIGRQKVIVKPIAAHGKGFMKVKLKADYPMYETIAVSFSSKLIRGINAVANIHIIGKMSSKQNENKAPQ